MPTTPITNWGQAVMTSLGAALALLLGAVPKIIGFLVIVLIGWFIAGLLARAVAAVLRAVKFNDLAERAGISGFVRNMGVHTDAAGVLADIVKWFVRLIVLVTAFDELSLPAISQVLQAFLLWLPNLVVALVVLVIAGLVARAAADLVRGATAESGLGNPNLFANLTGVAIWGFGIIIAVNQIGIAATLVDTLFTAFVGGLALAFALAFGLGGRETAGEIVHNWYQRSQQAAPKIQQATTSAGQKARQAAATVSGIRQQGQPSGETAPAADFETVEPTFRQHYASTYSSTGYDYNQIRPAYQMGFEAKVTHRYNGGSWNQVAPMLRNDWEQSYPDRPWSQVEDAFRKGWEAAPNR